jgi:hypothetical protein
MRCPPKEQRGITTSGGVNVRAFIGVSVIVAHASSSQWRRGVRLGLFGSKMALLPLVVYLTTLLLHRDLLRGRQRSGLPVVGLMVLLELPVEVGQLLVELAKGSCVGRRWHGGMVLAPGW